MANIDVNSLVASLPANVQEAIKALVAQELAKNQPELPKELTPREQLQLHLSLARQALQHAGNPVFYQDRILSALEQIAEAVFPEETTTESSTSTSTEA